MMVLVILVLVNLVVWAALVWHGFRATPRRPPHELVIGSDECRRAATTTTVESSAHSHGIPVMVDI